MLIVWSYVCIGAGHAAWRVIQPVGSRPVMLSFHAASLGRSADFDNDSNTDSFVPVSLVSEFLGKFLVYISQV